MPWFPTGTVLMPRQKTVILMPTYNDWPSVRALLPRIDSVLRREGLTAEVLVIDDGSNVSADIAAFFELGLQASPPCSVSSSLTGGPTSGAWPTTSIPARDDWQAYRVFARIIAVDGRMLFAGEQVFDYQPLQRARPERRDMNDGVRVGVVGAGHRGRNLLRSFHALGGLVGVCDTDRACLRAAADAYPEARHHESFAGLLADEAVDAVAIATPAATHGDMALQALDAGKHVFVEKPLCLKLRQADRLGERAAETGLCLMVGHLLLYHPAFVALREAVNGGRLGDLRYIYCNRLSLGKIRREENSLWSFAPHDISMILTLFDRMPNTVMTNGGTYLKPPVADTTLSHLKFDDGMQAHVFVSWLHPYKDHRMVVVGSDGMIVFDDVAEGKDKLLFYPHKAEWEGDIPVVDKAKAKPVVYDAAEPLAIECAHFLSCVAQGKTPVSDVEEGRRVRAVLDACQRSLNSGLPVGLDSGGAG